MLYEVWEGQYWANGMDKPSGPTFKGRFEANSFKEAVIMCYKNDPHFNEEKLTTGGLRYMIMRRMRMI